MYVNMAMLKSVGQDSSMGAKTRAQGPKREQGGQEPSMRAKTQARGPILEHGGCDLSMDGQDLSM